MLVFLATIALISWGYAVLFVAGSEKISDWTSSYPVGIRGQEFRATALVQGDVREDCFSGGIATLVYSDNRVLVLPHTIYRDARRPFDLGIAILIPADAAPGETRLSVSESYNCGMLMTRIKSPALRFEIR